MQASCFVKMASYAMLVARSLARSTLAVNQGTLILSPPPVLLQPLPSSLLPAIHSTLTLNCLL